MGCSSEQTAFFYAVFIGYRNGSAILLIRGQSMFFFAFLFNGKFAAYAAEACVSAQEVSGNAVISEAVDAGLGVL